MTPDEQAAVLRVLRHVEREDGFLDVAQVEGDADRVVWEARCEWPLARGGSADEVMIAHGETPLAAIVALAGGLT